MGILFLLVFLPSETFSLHFAATRFSFIKKVAGTAAGAAAGIVFLGETYSRTGSVKTIINGTSPPFSRVSSNDDIGYGDWGELFDGGGGVRRDITLVFHGAGGMDPYTNELMGALRRSKEELGSTISVGRMVQWDGDSSDLLRASVRGEKIGRNVANVIWEKFGDGICERGLRVHAVGISVGAFAANSLITEFDRLRRIHRPLSHSFSSYPLSDGMKLQLTLLDPFQQKAVIGLGYGARTFGRTADYAQQFYNTDDPVPSTGMPLPQCAAVDVTSLRPPEIFGHDWPLVYYAQNVLGGDKGNGSSDGGANNGGFVPNVGRREIGSVLVL